MRCPLLSLAVVERGGLGEWGGGRRCNRLAAPFLWVWCGREKKNAHRFDSLRNRRSSEKHCPLPYLLFLGALDSVWNLSEGQTLKASPPRTFHDCGLRGDRAAAEVAAQAPTRWARCRTSRWARCCTSRCEWCWTSRWSSVRSVGCPGVSIAVGVYADVGVAVNIGDEPNAGDAASLRREFSKESPEPSVQPPVVFRGGVTRRPHLAGACHCRTPSSPLSLALASLRNHPANRT